VTVKYRESEHNEVYAARRRGKLADLPLVCLVNQGSASASEIVAGCLRDHKRALLVGERTFGKGSVQNVFMVGQGTALKLTTARYYTPADKPIEDGKGIVPDIVVPMTAEALMALRTQVREDKLRGKYDPGTTGLNGEDEPPPAKPAKPETKPDAGGKKQATDEPGDEEDRERRERVRDDQLRAALCILLLQMDMAARTPKAAK
jgi:carboxyl-terminal processing protease